MHASEIELKLELDGTPWSEPQKFDESERDTGHHMDQMAHQSNILEAQGHGKTRSDRPGSFLAKGGGQWWDPLDGRPYLSAD